MILGALAVAVPALPADISRNKNRGRGSMWWWVFLFVLRAFFLHFSLTKSWASKHFLQSYRIFISIKKQWLEFSWDEILSRGIRNDLVNREMPRWLIRYPVNQLKSQSTPCSRYDAPTSFSSSSPADARAHIAPVTDLVPTPCSRPISRRSHARDTLCHVINVSSSTCSFYFHSIHVNTPIRSLDKPAKPIIFIF